MIVGKLYYPKKHEIEAVKRNCDLRFTNQQPFLMDECLDVWM